MKALTREQLRERIAEIVGIHIATAYVRGQTDQDVVTSKREDYKAADEILALLNQLSP